MSVSVVPRKRANRPSSINGLSKTRIRMLQNGISIQDLRNYIFQKDKFNLSHSVVSISLDESLVDYINRMANNFCNETEGVEEVPF